MFPIGDDNSEVTIFPIVNYGLIALNILVFVLLQQLGNNEAFTNAFSTVPKEIMTGTDLAGLIPIANSGGQEIHLYATPFTVYITLLASMFMHGGIMHIFGNMLYLFIFGDNLENRLGHVRYGIYYLLVGIIASLAHVFSDTSSVIPSLGASGAISGVLGGYMLLFPTKRVRVILFNFLTVVPSYVALGLWIVYQVVSSYLAGKGGGGVAYMAHIGGFIAGLVLIKLFALGTKAAA